ncbi:MAG: inorganic diphosphatase [Fibrobacterota bacterium]
MNKPTLLIIASTVFFCISPVSAKHGKHQCVKQQDFPVITNYKADPLLAPFCKIIPGDYANGIADTMIYLKNRDLNYYLDFAAKNDNNTINAAIEIPAGTNAKFETSIETGRMFWELKKGVPRLVKFLGYPGNYGMVPQTLSGDGDPLDVVVIGGNLLRGSVAQVKVIGVFKLIDGGDNDEKLIAVIPDSPLGELNTIEELNTQYPGVTEILKSWLTNYKGPDGELQSNGFGDVEEANSILDAAIGLFEANN